jgi:hypothetical protein
LSCCCCSSSSTFPQARAVRHGRRRPVRDAVYLPFVTQCHFLCSLAPALPTCRAKGGKIRAEIGALHALRHSTSKCAVT